MARWLYESFCPLTVRLVHKSYSLGTLIGALEDSLEQGGGHPQSEAHGGSTAQGDTIYLNVQKLSLTNLARLEAGFRHHRRVYSKFLINCF
jgi:hypothetical protein